MANSVEDYLIDSLSFKLQPGASYVQQRRSVSFYTSGSNSYSPTGTKVIRIQLNGDDWLDPSTVRVSFKLCNDDSAIGHRLRPICGPWTFFRRLRILCGGGQLVEDYSDMHRVAEMFSVLQSTNARDNDDIEGFGYRWDDSSSNLELIGTEVVQEWVSTNTMPGINQGSFRYVSFRLKSGLLSQPRYIPLRFCPLTIELEVCNSMSDPIIYPTSNISLPFNTINSSLLWHIEDVQIKCDLCTLDNALNNSYVEHLLSGKSLPIQYEQYFTLQQTASGSNSITVSITRSASRLKKVFFTLDAKPTGENTPIHYKSCNRFYHPMCQTLIQDGTGLVISSPIATTLMPPGATQTTTTKAYDPYYELEWQIQIGSRLFPEMPCRSLSEAFKLLRQAMHYPDFHQHSMDISEWQYRVDKFIVAFDFERVFEAGYTGINTKAGDLMVFKMKPAPGASFSGSIADTLYTTLVTDCVLDIKDRGCLVYD